MPVRPGRTLLCAVLAAVAGGAWAQEGAEQPNTLVGWRDHIFWQNVSAYGMGMMGYSRPNIGRIAEEGIRFTEHHAQPSCTVCRAAFLAGQHPIRSGMTTA